MRPVPGNARFISGTAVHPEHGAYDCIIGHSVTDLLELKHVDAPPAELGDYARLLLSDRELVGRLGSAARRKAAERFSSGRFVRGLTRAIDAAREHRQALKRGN